MRASLRGKSQMSPTGGAQAEEINDLRAGLGALILAHNYQRPEVQDIADHTGDSLELSRIAAESENPVIVFCGVRFMAESAAILCPEKNVLLPVPRAGCSLADAATAEQVRSARDRWPGATVVAYVNTSAEVKAESDICCTSANAVEIVRSVDEERPIIFVSDRNLGHYAASITHRDVILWEGACPTHEALRLRDVLDRKREHPGAEVMVHPECIPEVLEAADTVAGTAGMLAHAADPQAATKFIVGTDIGLIHQLKKQNPDKEFHPASEYMVCPTMKLTTLEDIASSLKRMEHVITVEEPVLSKARAALEAMLVQCS